VQLALIGAATAGPTTTPVPPPDGVTCLSPGLCIESSTLNAAGDQITVVVT
jgi:hypothetical protein